MLMQSDVSVERLRGAQFRRATEAGTGRNSRPRESVTITNEAALLELTPSTEPSPPSKGSSPASMHIWRSGRTVSQCTNSIGPRPHCSPTPPLASGSPDARSSICSTACTGKPAFALGTSGCPRPCPAPYLRHGPVGQRCLHRRGPHRPQSRRHPPRSPVLHCRTLAPSRQRTIALYLRPRRDKTLTNRQRPETRSRSDHIGHIPTRPLAILQATEFEATWGVVGDRPISCVRLWSSYDVNIGDGIIVAGLAKLHPYGKVRERLWDLGPPTARHNIRI